MNDSFETQAYAMVWTSSLNRFIEDGELIPDGDISLYSGGLPDDYSEHYTYIPVGKVKVKIPTAEQRHQTELAALELEIVRQSARDHVARPLDPRELGLVFEVVDECV